MAAEAGRERAGFSRGFRGGYLQATVEQLIQGQAELRQGQAELRAELRDVNKRIDKLMWGLIAGGIAIGGMVIGTLVTVLVNGGA